MFRIKLFTLLLILMAGCRPTADEDPELPYYYFHPLKDSLKLLHHVDYVPRNIEFVFDLNSALKLSWIENKPVLIIFTGVGCKSIKDIDWKVVKASDSENLIRSNYIVAFLFVDIIGKLKEPIQIMYEGKPKLISTIGKYNLYFQIERYKTNAQPYYCIVDHNMVDLADPRGYDLDSARFKDFLIKGLSEFRSNRRKLKSYLK